MSAGARVDAAALPETRQGRFWFDRESVLGPVLLLPAVIYIIALVGIPLVLAVMYSLSDVTVGDQSIDFVGLKNFRDALDNSTFRTALQNTFVFTIASQAIVLVLANILALVLSADFHGKRLVRFLVLLPWTTPIALGVLGWLWTLLKVALVALLIIWVRVAWPRLREDQLQSLAWVVLVPLALAQLALTAVVVVAL